jgi:gentisate 1,2-dioxygenase
MTDTSTPSRSRAERLWAHAGLRPVSASDAANSPLAAYRWEPTDAALQAQLELEDEGHPGVVEPGHAAVRYSNPTTGRDALVTLRTEMHRFRAGVSSATRRQVGSSVWQVFEGSGVFELGPQRLSVTRGDVVAIPSWCPTRIVADSGLDAFVFSDAPVYEALKLSRTAVD